MKKVLAFFVLILSLNKAYSQPGVTDGTLDQASANFRSDFYALSSTIFVIAGIVALVGAIRIYHKWQLGEPIVQDLSGWFYACLFIIVANLFIRGLFGL